jgi:cytoskeleton protein RodZ
MKYSLLVWAIFAGVCNKLSQEYKGLKWLTCFYKKLHLTIISAKQRQINIFVSDFFMTPEKATPKGFLDLRTKREALRLTLQDISGLTRISLVNLEAIENGAFCDLPAPIYTKNFIKSYARALSLDSKPILDSYEAYLISLQTVQTTIPETEPPKEPLIRRIAPYKAYITVAAIIIVVAVVTFIIFQQQQPVPSVAVPQPSIIPPVSQPAENPPGNTPEQAAPPKTDAQPVVAATKTALPQQKNAASVIIPPKQNLPLVEKKATSGISEGTDILVIKATEETWLRMKIDENPPFQVLLRPGEEIKRTGAGFALDIGNAGGLTMQFKGKTIENLGKSGEVVHLQLP